MTFWEFFFAIATFLVVLWSAGIPIAIHLVSDKVGERIFVCILITTLIALFSLVGYSIYRGVNYAEVRLEIYEFDKEKVEEFPELRPRLVGYLEDDVLLKWEHNEFLEHYERAKVNKTIQEIKE